MNVSLYFDLRNPRQWEQDSARLYGFTLEMCEEAERLGAHAVWVTEHHLFDDGYLPQPLTFAAAIAARTTRVRIGTGIVIAPLHHPVHIAEQAAVVDIISDGRLDLGLGAGYRVPEFALFGADITQRYSTTDDRVRELRRIWAEGKVTPAPRQNPLPIWLGYQGPQGARRAGRLGEGLLSGNPELVGPYREGLAEGGHDPASGRMAGNVQGWISDDPEGDWPVVATHLAAQWDSYRRYMVEGTDQPVPPPVDPERWRMRREGGGLPRFLLATPEEAADLLRAHFMGTPVESIYFWASLAGMPEALVARNVQTLCTRLAPLLNA
jgi:alkanesulfonate monooxygenase SsuD/methylene tetrahydromethanopterin reductase-like flavin-dependent oxidoreductase (luciferase family)